MKFENSIAQKTKEAIYTLYNVTIETSVLTIQRTKKEFEGDFTLVTFSLTRFIKKSPDILAEELGNWLVNNVDSIDRYNVIKGFLNLNLKFQVWNDFFNSDLAGSNYGLNASPSEKPYIVEFSSPNTNKPLHLGHIRNNLLGASVSQILKAVGKNVIRVNLVNDRGIHICKSMLAWQTWGNNETPQSSGLKGDHLVGKYYVLFEQKYRPQVNELIAAGNSEEDAAKMAPLMIEAQDMLHKWEAKDDAVVELWRMMNSWVYEGFDITYRQLGIEFEKTYHESETYLLGKVMVEEGLRDAAFFQKEDGSVWADLTAAGLDEKLLMRANGTSVYITQDLGTAQARYDSFLPEKLIYVVGNEQIYHFDVLKSLLNKLGRSWAADIFHLSYGMVELPQGKMKSREGTVVDADDLLQEMYNVAKDTTEALGKTDTFSPDEADKLYWMLALGALKFFMLKVDPKKSMLFNPQDSIDFNGHTGPFIQYTHARIQSLQRKAKDTIGDWSTDANIEKTGISETELSLIKTLYEFPAVLSLSADNYSPALIANYVYELCKEYNRFYQEVPVLKAEDKNDIYFRLKLSGYVGKTVKKSMALLGIEVPDKM